MPSSELIAYRRLFSRDRFVDIELAKPLEVDKELWKARVVIRFPDRRIDQEILAVDSFDCLYNAFMFIRKTMQDESTPWSRFPESNDEWHWFSRIVPCLGQEFDEIADRVVTDTYTAYCQRQKTPAEKAAIEHRYRRKS